MSQFRASRRGASCVFESNIDIALDKIFLARATTCTPISRSRNFSRASQLLMYHGYSSPDLENYLEQHDVTLVTPKQFMDKWRLDSTGIRELDNRVVKETLGFSNVQSNHLEKVYIIKRS